MHLLFTHPGGSLMGQAAPGVDVKDRGYIVAPPSIHPSGEEYVWSVDGHPEDMLPVELPPAWLDRLRRTTRATAPEGLNVDHQDALRRIPSVTYVQALTGREVMSNQREPGAGWVRCPFHGGGGERTPSLKVDGTLWSCFACPPMLGKQVMGGNIYDFAGLILDLPLPLRGADFSEVRDRLCRRLGVE